MAKSCLYSPVDKNGVPFKALPQYKKALGNTTGSNAFLKALSPSFQERYKGILDIDDQGVATLDTALKTPDMKKLVGFETIKAKLEKEYGFTEVADTADNFRMLINEAKNFNSKNNDYIAYPEVQGDRVRNVVHRKTEDTVNMFNDLYGCMVLNDRLVEMFEPLGLTPSLLTEAERSYSGITDFSKAKDIANGFSDIIRVANNMAGQKAMSEEFSHVIVRMLQDRPIIQRLFSAFSNNPETMAAVLGDDYKLYVDKFTDEEGVTDFNPIAEECIGRLLQRSLLDNINNKEERNYLQKLWERAYNYIKKLFKDYDYREVEQAILEADQTIDDLAKNLLKGNISFTREDIANTSKTALEREMEAIKAKAIADGTFMKAPNGKPTNLTERQWLQVRTKNFINWFGDWINDSENASKVVDENGEPKVMLRTDDANKTTMGRGDGGSFFATDNLMIAGSYASDDADLYKGFVNLKNPYVVKGESHGFFFEYKGEETTVQKAQPSLIQDGYDGVYFERTWDVGDYADVEEGDDYWANNVAMFNPNQFKSATNNNGEFSTSNDNIMYHLEKDVEYLKEIVEDAIAVETKKTKIIKNENAVSRAEKKIDNLNAILNGTPEGRLKGIINYAHAAVNDFGAAREALSKSKEGERNFGMLRGVRATIQSYDEFISQLADLINSKDDELHKLVYDTSIEDKNHVEVTLNSAHEALTRLRDLVKSEFEDVALASIEEFFKPFFNVEGGEFIDGSGKRKTLHDLIKEAYGDIGFTDKYFMTMSNSGDLMLQLFDEVVKKAKANARFETIEDITEITRLMLDAEEKGITDFGWMYEKDSEGHKTGNYISAVNVGQYEKDRAEFIEKLNVEYGLNPTGVKAKEKRKKRKEWIQSHGKIFGSRPNEAVYHNREFDRLSDAQKEILNRFMMLKQKFDKRLPNNKVSTIKAIQMRRTSQQRYLNTLSNPSKVFENIKESIAKEFTRSSDDEDIYGVKTGLRSFDGTEFKVLPALYTTRLSNPEELTSDVFSALAAYSYSTNTYRELDKVVDPLEIAKSYMFQDRNRKVKEVANGKGLAEKIGGVVKPIFKSSGTNIEGKLESFMDSQVYMRYYADSDQTINVMGREIKAGKIINKWLSTSSLVQLGFNALAHLGNVATGSAMQNIEALCGHYFNAKELFKADKEYLAALKSYLPEMEARNITNKLALFDQKFDIKQEFAGNIKERMNTLFEKLFGKSVAFLGQTCGDHWLYNRTAIAMCLRKKVRLSDGTVTTLWDALKVTNAFEGDNRIKKLTIDATDVDTGEVIDDEWIRKYSAKINEINHRLFGVYNTDDMVAAQRTALGRCILQYRQWIVPMFARRFQNRRYVEALEEYEEGYYRTAFNVLMGLKGGLAGIAQVWEELDEPQKRNIYRAGLEIAQFMAIWAIANFVSFGKDDPDRAWGLKLAEYMAQRELHELGNLTPSFTMGNEILKTVKSPASILNTTQAAMNLFSSLLDPRDWNDEIESGKYEGMSTLHKNFLKAPFPILSPFNQLDRFVYDIEDVTRYYARNY